MASNLTLVRCLLLIVGSTSTLAFTGLFSGRTVSSSRPGATEPKAAGLPSARDLGLLYFALAPHLPPPTPQPTSLAHGRTTPHPSPATLGTEGPAAAAVSGAAGAGAVDPRKPCGSVPEEWNGGGWGGACYDAAADGVIVSHGRETVGATRDSQRAEEGEEEGSAASTSSPVGAATTTATTTATGAAARAAATRAAAAAAAAGGGGGGASSSRPPVIFLPPLTGTVLEARLVAKPSVPRWWCPRRTSGWFRLWLPLRALLPWQFPCFADNLRLLPDGPGGTTRSPPGVEVRLGPALEPDHGDPLRGGFNPWGALADRLRQMGWADDLLTTHPYDWRLSPPDWRLPGGSFHQLRAQVEALVAASGMRVVLLGLSLGGTYGAAFLTSGLVDSDWKERHVERLVAISGVWAGTPRSALDVVSGRLQGLEAVLEREAARQLVRGIPSLAWAFPAPGLFADGRSVVSNVAIGRNYSAEQMGQALRDAGAPETAAFWEAALTTMLTQAPGVATHCFYSYGLSTAVHVSYSQPDFSDARPVVAYGDGDITVPYSSLAACRQWAAKQGPPVYSSSYYGVVHAMLTEVPEALEDIVAAVAGDR